MISSITELPEQTKIVTIDTFCNNHNTEVLAMTTSISCPIKLLNKTYDIKCPEQEADNLHMAADKLNEQLLQNKKQFRQLDDFQNLVLAALHISHELISCKKQQEEQRNQVTRFMNSLDSKNGTHTHINPMLDPQTD